MGIWKKSAKREERKRREKKIVCSPRRHLINNKLRPVWNFKICARWSDGEATAYGDSMVIKSVWLDDRDSVVWRNGFFFLSLARLGFMYFFSSQPLWNSSLSCTKRLILISRIAALMIKVRKNVCTLAKTHTENPGRELSVTTHVVVVMCWLDIEMSSF